MHFIKVKVIQSKSKCIIRTIYRSLQATQILCFTVKCVWHGHGPAASTCGEIKQVKKEIQQPFYLICFKYLLTCLSLKFALYFLQKRKEHGRRKWSLCSTCTRPFKQPTVYY